MGPTWAKTDFFKSDPRPLGVPKHMVLPCFEAYLGCFHIPYVLEPPTVEPVWDQEEVKSGPKGWVSNYATILPLMCFWLILRPIWAVSKLPYVGMG